MYSYPSLPFPLSPPLLSSSFSPLPSLPSPSLLPSLPFPLSPPLLSPSLSPFPFSPLPSLPSPSLPFPLSPPLLSPSLSPLPSLPYALSPSLSTLPSLPFPLSLPPSSLPFTLSSSCPELFSGQPIHAISSSLLSHPSTNPFPSPAAAHASVSDDARTPPTSPTLHLLGLPPSSTRHPSFALFSFRLVTFQEPSPCSLCCNCCPIPPPHLLIPPPHLLIPPPHLLFSPCFHPHPSPFNLFSPRFHPYPSPINLFFPRFDLTISSPLYASNHHSLPSRPPFLHPSKNLSPLPYLPSPSFPPLTPLPFLPIPALPSMPFPSLTVLHTSQHVCQFPLLRLQTGQGMAQANLALPFPIAATPLHSRLNDRVAGEASLPCITPTLFCSPRSPFLPPFSSFTSQLPFFSSLEPSFLPSPLPLFQLQAGLS
ncbi:unnamed protein product [Closterium sp. Naga37s-1]|nr:unnamed protein product [Closterium sp. Naga37s-1]